MLRELVPQAKRFAALVNPNFVYADAVITSARAGAASIGLPIDILQAGTVPEIDAAFAKLAEKPGNALLISPDPFFYWPSHTNRDVGGATRDSNNL